MRERGCRVIPGIKTFRGTLVLLGVITAPLVAAVECGWLLVIPPTYQDPLPSVAEWKQLGAFDSAKECERERGLFLIRVNEEKAVWTAEQRRRAERLAQEIRCLPSSSVPVR